MGSITATTAKYAYPDRRVTYQDEFGNTLHVKRMAKDGSWADIHVRQESGASWTKRQWMSRGRFPFLVREVSA